MNYYHKLGALLAKQANENQAGTEGARSGMLPRDGGASQGGLFGFGKQLGNPFKPNLQATSAPAVPMPRPAPAPAPAPIAGQPGMPNSRIAQLFRQPAPQQSPPAQDPLSAPEPLASRESNVPASMTVTQ